MRGLDSMHQLIAKRRSKNNKQGFTIIELMIATTIFSVVLVVATSGIISIGRIYYKGITSTKTQEAARHIMDEVSRARQFSGDNKTYTPAPVGGYEAFCFGEARFTYSINRQVREGVPGGGLIYSSKTLADPQCVPEATGEEMLGTNMRLLDFSTTSIGKEKYRISVKVAYGDDDLLTHYDDNGALNGQAPADALCKNGIAGSNFCHVAELATIVNKRIK